MSSDPSYFVQVGGLLWVYCVEKSGSNTFDRFLEVSTDEPTSVFGIAAVLKIRVTDLSFRACTVGDFFNTMGR
jgi:hypothetical protein